jgi:hypothetical protein
LTGVENKLLRGRVLRMPARLARPGSGAFIRHKDSVRGFGFDVVTGPLREVA